MPSGPLRHLAVRYRFDPVDRLVREIEPRRPVLTNPPGIGSNNTSNLGDLGKHLGGHCVAIVLDQLFLGGRLQLRPPVLDTHGRSLPCLPHLLEP